MPRPHKIWYWKAREEWCVKVNRIRHRLGLDKAEAELKFHAMMANPEKPVDPQSVAAIIDKFLAWTKQNREKRTYDGYQQHCQSFLDSLEDQSLTVGKLKPHHVHAWVDTKDWGPTFKRGAMGAEILSCLSRDQILDSGLQILSQDAIMVATQKTRRVNFGFCGERSSVG